VIVCVDPAQAPRTIAGRWYDATLLDDLRSGVDPCGENGEFHTVVVDGPGFGRPSMSRSARSWSATGSSSPT
jgi:diphthamide synthase (EF-2-diphthine--ammonia ligase)